MQQAFTRSGMVLGIEAMDHIEKMTVAVFGVGGVGSYVVEGLVRSGIGNLILVDNDTICVTNLNRQLMTNVSNIGQSKVEVIKERALSINPQINIKTYEMFVLPDNMDEIFDNKIDYIVDAIDTVTAKIALVMKAQEKNIPIIASMGTGNKLDPTRLEVGDIFDTSICPLCKVMRKELKKRDIKSLKVVYSKEEPAVPDASLNLGCGTQCHRCDKGDSVVESARRSTPGSVSFVPSVAGLIIASQVIKEVLSQQ